MRLIVLFALLGFLGMIFYQNLQHPQLRLNPLLDRITHPFDQRIRYRIAEVDPRFNLSEVELKQISQQATDIWKQGLGKDYFVYDPDARLSIHLIYDQRQDESVQRRDQLTKLTHNEQGLSQKNTELKAMQENLARNEVTLDMQKQSLQELSQNYNAMIRQYNQHGGVPPSQQAAVQQSLAQLRQQQQVLDQQIASFNLQVNAYNQKVDELNRLDQGHNLAIDQFNQRFQPRLFDKGLFNGREIHIYEFESEDDLRMTLAHEFGHALGMKHHNDPKALMYPMLDAQDMQHFRLQNADIALFNTR
ncbi:matrixin [Acinetobacter sp. WCHA55]|uniref:matrixin family metalloprotease n=1 Tax=Acinetobacter sp. WCHA55 TaxID=2004646 RepID=UPI000B3C8357|nr:matrixin family metalloprotease [Acinetobacter sp. WCHA55]AYA67389.1 matrixin [Acinetobacter sp. WCHA55]